MRPQSDPLELLPPELVSFLTSGFTTFAGGSGFLGSGLGLSWVTFCSCGLSLGRCSWLLGLEAGCSWRLLSVSRLSRLPSRFWLGCGFSARFSTVLGAGLSACLSVGLDVDLSGCLSVGLDAGLSGCLSVGLDAGLSVCLSAGFLVCVVSVLVDPESLA